MSSYMAIIRCAECKKVLAEITAFHDSRPDRFVPQDIQTSGYKLPSVFCQDCLNKEVKHDNC